MKVFDIVCDDGHRFEGWFASAEEFAAQSEASTIRCPLCDSGAVHREPSAPRLNIGDVPRATTDATAVAQHVMTRLRELVRRTEDVGPRFAEEARRIHYDETTARPIRGTATESERRDLRDEGIETFSVPIPRALTETMQ